MKVKTKYTAHDVMHEVVSLGHDVDPCLYLADCWDDVEAWATEEADRRNAWINAATTAVSVLWRGGKGKILPEVMQDIAKVMAAPRGES